MLVIRNYRNIPITLVIGTKFLSEQIAKDFATARKRRQNVPIKICPYGEIKLSQKSQIRKKFL